MIPVQQIAFASPSRTQRSLKNRMKSGVVARKGHLRLARTTPKYDGFTMSLQDFEAWQREADGWKYEWNQGKIEINEASMTVKEQFLVKNISRAFQQTVAFLEGGEILAEVDCLYPSGQMRRADLAFFTAEQIRQGREGALPVPSFVIEIVSQHDKIKAIHTKIDEYFRNGVLAVWYIFPDEERVDVYTSPKHVHICTRQDTCSAAPALDFSMTAEDVFR